MKKIVRISVWLVFIVVGLLLMSCAYSQWSMYGNYTVASFCVSLLIHLSPMLLIAYYVTKHIR